jgi:hypothetical protein
MVAYSFKPSFVAPIISREKQQTIRRPRKRQTRVGDALQFFTGPRMRPVRIGAATCEGFNSVRLDFSAQTLTIDDTFVIKDFEQLNAFAIRDGFRPNPRQVERGITPWEYMALWWRMTHPDTPIFTGELVDWGQTFVAAP